MAKALADTVWLLVSLVTTAQVCGLREQGLLREARQVVRARLVSLPSPHLRIDHLSREENVTVPLESVTDLLSPHYQLVTRQGVNTTVPFPTCLYTGRHLLDSRRLIVSLSSCSEDGLQGTLQLEDQHFVLKPIEDKEEVARVKRHLGQDEVEEEETEEASLHVVTQSQVDGECGLNQRNKARLMAAERPIVNLLRESQVRRKRETDQKTIEVAVFVDDVMYRNIAGKQRSGSPKEKIQETVFTYLNAVQTLYQSGTLGINLRLLLVKLFIMEEPEPDLDKHSGDIEGYLDSFCKWQRQKNPGAGTGGDIDDRGHWDHALLLTGLDMYDGSPDRDSVIGLAWVAGMCNPRYSCTINEGNNFESVYVITHEMGHNLGMNHDGETMEGNTCSANKYLMSPVLGPGKVTWSACSGSELRSFLTGFRTRNQAKCLNDMPEVLERYNFNKENKLPGMMHSAMKQCQVAFSDNFKPHVKRDSPFEDLCRELWCSNTTHALRAHPALEGTDCKSTPFPYGSICRAGRCVPYNPNSPQSTQSPGGGQEEEPSDPIDDSPPWYDPIYTGIFTDLRRAFKKRYPVLSLQSMRQPSGFAHNEANREEAGARSFLQDDGGGFPDVGGGADNGPSWRTRQSECSVICGGGWSSVRHVCEQSGVEVNSSRCRQDTKPTATRQPCATEPCQRQP